MDRSKRYKTAYVQRKRRHYKFAWHLAIAVIIADVIVICALLDRIILTDGETLYSSSRLDMVLLAVLAAAIVLLPVLILTFGIITYKRSGWRGYRRPQ